MVLFLRRLRFSPIRVLLRAKVRFNEATGMRSTDLERLLERVGVLLWPEDYAGECLTGLVRNRTGRPAERPEGLMGELPKGQTDESP